MTDKTFINDLTETEEYEQREPPHLGFNIEWRDNKNFISRRTVLKWATTTSAVLIAGSGNVAAGEDSEFDPGDGDSAPLSIDIEVWFEKRMSQRKRDISERAIHGVADDIQEQIESSTNVMSFNSSSNNYNPKANNETILDNFRKDHRSDIKEGQINLLVVDHKSPSSSVAHDSVLSRDSAPVVVFNYDFRYLSLIVSKSHIVFRNLIKTALLRPILGSHKQDAPKNPDVNSFGTIYESDKNEASPLATWHTKKDDCNRKWKRLPSFDKDDTIRAACRHNEPPQACYWSEKLSSCTKDAVNHHLNNEYLLNSHIITIEDTRTGAKSDKSYIFKVEGSLEKSEAMGATKNSDDTIKDRNSRTVVQGSTRSKRDSYEYTGRITKSDFSDVHNVYIDGERVRPKSLNFDTVEIRSENADGNSYEIQTTSTLRRNNLNTGDCFISDRKISGCLSGGKVNIYTFYGGIVIDGSDYSGVHFELNDSFEAYTHGSATPKCGLEEDTCGETIIADFESGNLNGWTVNKVGGTGDSNVHVTDDNPYEGTYSLDYHGNIRTWIVSSGAGLPYPQRGDSFELRWYYATRGSGGFGFAAQSDSFDNGYQVQVRSDTWSKHPDTVTLYRREGGRKSKQIAQASFDMSAYTGQYLRWTVEWGDPTITITGYTTDGTEIVTLDGDDAKYDQGGIQCEANCTDRDVVYFDAWKFINR